MIEFSTAIWICIGLLVYYSIFFTVDALKKGSRATNTPNRTIAELRTRFKVNIKTFNRNGDARDGFSWLKSIWINEIVFRDDERLRFVFFHEYYHLKHYHKYLNLLFRLILPLEFILLAYIPWFIFTPIIISSCVAVYSISMDEKRSLFERKANEYATKMMADEQIQRKSSNI